MKLYAISGLGADQRVFQALNLEHELVPLEWITPEKNESIESYALRLADKVNSKEEFGIIAVSFGGLVAIEIAKKLKPKVTVLISSVSHKSELRKVYRLFGRTRIVKIIPSFLFNHPRFIAHWLFGAKQKKLLSEILKDTDLKFTKWALNALLTWRNTEIPENLIRINGTNDKLIPPKGKINYRVDKGEHFMIVDKAEVISNAINREIKLHAS